MTLWGITDGSAGMISQVQGLGELLAQQTGGSFTLKRCIRAEPWAALPGWFSWNALHQLTAESDRLEPPFPDVVLTSGRRSAALAIALKRASKGATYIVHITDPRISPRYFDLVVAMQHDKVKGRNVLHTQFALHNITCAKLEQARDTWNGSFLPYPAPRVAVLCGGTTNRYTMTENATVSLGQSLRQIRCGSLLVTVSRRTGPRNTALLERELEKSGPFYFYNGAGDNPYLGLLACADYIVVTNDSVNMMSEAVFTGKPVYIAPLAGHVETKPAQFAQMLVKQGIAKWMQPELTSWTYQAADDRQIVATAILNLFK